MRTRSGRSRRQLPGGIVGRRDRVLRECMEDVRQHQLLVLLLVIEPDFDEWLKAGPRIRAALAEEFHHGGIDMATVGGDLVGGGTGTGARAERA